MTGKGRAVWDRGRWEGACLVLERGCGPGCHQLVICAAPHRMAGFDGSAWDEEEEEPAPDHQYYNDFPGKEPPIGGVVDMRLRDGAAQTPSHLGATLVRLQACPRHRGDMGTPAEPWVLHSGLLHPKSQGTCLCGASGCTG